MIPTWAIRAIASLAAVGLLWAGLALWGQHRYAQGEAAIQALWQADTAKRDAAAAQAIAKAEADKNAALASNQEIESEYQKKLAATESDRDQYVGLLQRARDQIRSLASHEATSLTIAAQAGATSRSERIQLGIERAESAAERIGPECTDNANQLDALIAEIKPQL